MKKIYSSLIISLFFISSAQVFSSSQLSSGKNKGMVENAMSHCGSIPKCYEELKALSVSECMSTTTSSPCAAAIKSVLSKYKNPQ